jgi:hypothetical protein
MNTRSRAGRTITAIVVLLLTCGVADASARPARRTTCSAADYDGNPLYGPRSLPNDGPIGQMLGGYRRFAGMTPGAYVRKWYLPASPPPTPPLEAGWKYPPLGGYLLTAAGRPVKMAAIVLGDGSRRVRNRAGPVSRADGNAVRRSSDPTPDARRSVGPGRLRLPGLRGAPSLQGAIRADRPGPRTTRLRLSVRPGLGTHPRPSAPHRHPVPDAPRRPQAHTTDTRLALASEPHTAVRLLKGSGVWGVGWRRWGAVEWV